MRGVKTVKVQVMVNENMVKKIDEYADAIGMSRSALCGYFIGQGMFSMNKGLEMATKSMQSLVDASVKNGGTDGQMDISAFLSDDGNSGGDGATGGDAD